MVPPASLGASSPAFAVFCNEMRKKNPLIAKRSNGNSSVQREFFKILWSTFPQSRRIPYRHRAQMASLFGGGTATEFGVPASCTMTAADKKLLKPDASVTLSESDVQEVLAQAAIANPKRGKSMQDRSPTEMTLPDTFTEMIKTVAPTRLDLFVAVAAHIKERHGGAVSVEATKDRFRALSSQDQAVFRQIRAEEESKFEKFCSKNAASAFLNGSIDIVALYTAFRGIKPLPTNHKTHVIDGLYKSLLSTDTIHDSELLRTKRALSRLAYQRSSDCGVYLHRSRASPHIDPRSYTLRSLSTLDTLSVAELLVDTRKGMSVYDDVLVRTNLLRSPLHSKDLMCYRVDHFLRNDLLEAAVQTRQNATPQKLTKTLNLLFQQAEKAAAQDSKIRTHRRSRAPPRPRAATQQVTAPLRTPQRTSVIHISPRHARATKALPLPRPMVKTKTLLIRATQPTRRHAHAFQLLPRGSTSPIKIDP